MQETFRRIHALDGELNAFCTLDEAGALAAARALDARIAAGAPAGPLAGVPVGVKDLLATRGLRTTYGSRLYRDHVPQEDDVVVERLRAADAIVVGKTNTSEFGYGAFGHNALFRTTRNPWNLQCTSGGSSAGSAAAVAAGLVPLALGSDGGGSIRLPAALCGIVGFKPSMGRVPVYPGCRDERLPGVSSWESLEHIGPLVRSAADAALALSVLAGPDPRDRVSIPDEIDAWAVPPEVALRGRRLAFSPDLGFATVDPEVRVATEALARRLGDALGCTVDVAHPGFGNPGPTFEALVALQTDRQGLVRLAAEQGVELHGWLARLLAREWTADEFRAAHFARQRIVNATQRFMARYDFLLTPTTACPAFALDCEGPPCIDGLPVDLHAWVGFAPLGNFTGLPAVSVPAGVTAGGLPVGLQIMGRHLDDLGVLGLAAAAERIAPFAMAALACKDPWS
ncbi:amidase [Niveibacterium sp. SC-1]|uniref:amidase n=1 Tax=Niveibacterium sp. SC-1 TaxID=3135646 RepID=UPI00311FC8EA